MHKQKSISLIIALMLIISLIQVYSFKSIGASTIIETLNQSICLSLPNSNPNSSATWTLGSCTLHASTKQSPFFLTNSSTELIIPSATILNLNSGFGFANYGTLNNSLGSIVISAPYLNYGTTLNYHTITLNNVWAQLNTTSANALTGLFTNQAGATITVSASGHFNNYNSVINLGTFQNNGDTRDCTANGVFRGTISGTVTGNSVVTTC